MKLEFLFLLVIFTTSSCCYSQNNLFEKSESLLNHFNNIPSELSSKKTTKHKLLSEGLIYDCNTVFWTVNNIGEIQQWDLNSNQVSGGAIVQTNCGNSLSFCGANGLLTFYSVEPMMISYNSASGWANIPTSISLLNNGGFHEDQYFFRNNGSDPKDLYHFDGTTLSLIEHLPDYIYFQVADIAVDSLGRAWVFTGISTANIDTVRVYDKNGLVASYPFALNGWGCYGSFFINDQLYIGVGQGAYVDTNNQNSILPINVNGSIVSTGIPIPFPYLNYYDMASCNKLSNLNIKDNSPDKFFLIYPNPSEGKINIGLEENIVSATIYSLEGKLIKTFNNAKIIDISDMKNETYLLKIISENNVYYKIIIKK